MKRSMRAKMKKCAKRNRVATKAFWRCVRGGKRKARRRSRR